MKQWKYAFLIFLMLPVHELYACPPNEVRIGGECRSAEWITSNLVGDDDKLLAYGPCLSIVARSAGCAMWFSEEKRKESLSFETRIQFLSNDTCTDGPMCVGGYSRLARLSLDFGIHEQARDVYNSFATLSMAAGTSGEGAEPIGSISWTHAPSSYATVTYPNESTSRGTIASEPFSEGYYSCTATVTAMLEGGGVETPVSRIVTEGMSKLETAQGTRRRGGEQTFAAINTTMTRAVSKTIGTWADKGSLCHGLYVFEPVKTSEATKRFP